MICLKEDIDILINSVRIDDRGRAERGSDPRLDIIYLAAWLVAFPIRYPASAGNCKR